MTRKLLTITTAIVALAVAPAVYGQTYGTNKPATPPAANQMQAPKAPAQSTELKGQTMSPKESASKVEKKGTSKASLAAVHATPAYKEMNAKEQAMTRDLNRQAVSGGVPQSAMTQSSMAPMSSTNDPSVPTGLPMYGAVPAPANEAGATGPGNTGDNPTSSK